MHQARDHREIHRSTLVPNLQCRRHDVAVGVALEVVRDMMRIGADHSEIAKRVIAVVVPFTGQQEAHLPISGRPPQQLHFTKKVIAAVKKVSGEIVWCVAIPCRVTASQAEAQFIGNDQPAQR